VSRSALIVGAGIGGLSAALALRQVGWLVRIFERAASARELGFGLGLAPNAMAALRELGVADTVLAQGFEPRSGELRRPDGTVLKRVVLPPGTLRGPMIVALRPALHGALLNAVGPDLVTAGSRVTAFTESGGRVGVQLATGETAQADLLVGADGVKSVVRSAFHPAEPEPRSIGIVAVRGAVHGAVHHLGGLGAVFYMGPGIESAVIRASDTGIYWFLSLARQLVPDGLRDPAAIVRRLAPRFDTTFQAVTSATEELRCDELVDRDPIPWWGKGAVTLLGDAAHPLLPHTGQGAAQAIVDAVTLAKMLKSSADGGVESALRAYERERLPKVTALLAQGRRTARIMRTTNPVLCHAREAVVRVMPVQAIVRFYAKINRRAGTDATSRT
jgi:2-polyprenyl-6-methoxyphenol hydroxylase-like FAD-dependent oxidoreductase